MTATTRVRARNFPFGGKNVGKIGLNVDLNCLRKAEFLLPLNMLLAWPSLPRGFALDPVPELPMPVASEASSCLLASNV